MRRTILLAVLVVSLVTVSLSAATPYLVKDINTNPAELGSGPDYFQVLGNITFFHTSQLGTPVRQLWRTDGTTAGTILLATDVRSRALWNGKLWFVAADGLWSTDGTVAGTQKLTLPAAAPALAPTHVLAGPAYLYFLSNGNLWRTDGTTSGTIQQSTVTLTPPWWVAAGSFSPWSVISGQTLYFLATTGSGTANSLYKIDAAGLAQVKDFGVPDVFSLQTAGALVYVRKQFADRSMELWRSDGTAAGTFALKSTQPIALYGANDPAVVGSLIYFTGDDGSGRKLWRTDGTNAGTVPLASSLPGATATFDAVPLLLLPSGKLLLAGATLPAGPTGSGIWSFDGTTTTFLANTASTTVPRIATVAGTFAVFGSGTQLWRTDGTIGGTFVLRTTTATTGFRMWSTAVLGSTIVFGAHGDVHGDELWKTDGSAVNTVLVKDIIEAYYTSSPEQLTPFRGGLLFTASSDYAGVKSSATRDLWFSDGTEAGTTTLLTNVVAGKKDIVACGNFAFFSHTTATSGEEPWITDGTAAGTHLLADLFPGVLPPWYSSPGTPNSSKPWGATCVDGAVLFYAKTTLVDNAYDSWRTDGTAAGTRRVKSFGSSFLQAPLQPARLGHLLLMPAIASSQVRLWRSDASGADVAIVRDFPNTTQLDATLVAGQYLYLSTHNSDNTYTLWRSDGTTAGTVALVWGAAWIDLHADFHGRLTYGWANGAGFQGYCTTDGSNAGTCFVPAAGTTPLNLAMKALNGRLYYNLPDLRSTDGFSELRSGSEPVDTLLATAGGRLYLNGQLSGTKRLLETDGTLAGTQSLGGIVATATSSGGRLYLSKGELYALELDVTPTGFSPASITTPGGQTVTIAGRGFTAPVTIRVGGINAAIGTVTPASIAFTAPQHDAGSYAIDLTLGDGRRMTLEEQLTYTCTAPTAALSAPVTASCASVPVTLQGSGGTRCAWFPATGLDDASSCTPKVTISGPVTYTLVVYNATGCASTNNPTVTLDLAAPPNATITLPSGPLRANTTYTASVPDAGSGSTYRWSATGATLGLGDGTTTIRFTTTCAAVQELRVTVVTAAGCSRLGIEHLQHETPTVDSIAPAVANPGTTMTMTGNAFECVNGVTLGDSDGTWLRSAAYTRTRTTLQFRNPGGAPRSIRAMLSTPAAGGNVAFSGYYQRSSRRDFQADAMSDVLWRNSATGQPSLWFMDLTGFRGEVITTVPPLTWSPAAIGDFNGDARADILWSNPATGETSIWLMNGRQVTTAVRSNTVPLAWKAAGTGDFNGDGKADLFWHNTTTGETSIWLMNGTTFTALRGTTVPVAWKPVAFGDFNGDAMGDVFWRNPTTGETSIWLMNGATITTAVRSETLAAPWSVAGSGDFDRDGKEDLLWWNSTTGETAFWYLKGAVLAGKKSMPVMPAGWQPVAVGHFGTDDAADVFWYNTTNGATQVWALTSSPTLPFRTWSSTTVTDRNWKPVILP